MSDYPNAGKQPPQAQPEIVRLGEPLKFVSSLDVSNLVGSALSPYKENLPVSATSARTSGHIQISRAEYAALQKMTKKIASRMVRNAGMPFDHIEDAAGAATRKVYEAHCKHLETTGGVKGVGYYYNVAKYAIIEYIDEQKWQSGYIDIKVTTKDVLLHMSLEDMYDYAHRETGLSHRHLSSDEMRAWVMKIVSPPQNAESQDLPKDGEDVESDKEGDQDTDESPVPEKPTKKIRPPKIGIFQSTEHLGEDGESVSLIDQLKSTVVNVDELIEKRDIWWIVAGSWKDCICELTKYKEKPTPTRAKATQTYTAAFEMFWTSQDEDAELTAKNIAEHLDVSEASISTMFQAIYGCLKMKLIEQRAIDYLKVSETFKRAADVIHRYESYGPNRVEVEFFDGVRFSESICLARFCSLNNISEAYVLKLHYQYKSKIKSWIDLCLELEKSLIASQGAREIPSDTLSKIQALARAM